MFRPVYSVTLRTYVVIFPQNAIVDHHLTYDDKFFRYITVFRFQVVNS